MSYSFNLDPVTLSRAYDPLRQEVRDFVKPFRASWSGWKFAHTWGGIDKEFSKAVGAKGWIGMTWPKQYGGAERSQFERYVVVEELIAAGAPLAAHWVGDRQTGPLLMRYGSQDLCQSLLPRIVSGELTFCIGLSEPGSGSDLASVRSRADRVDGGYQLNGQKIWTSGAHVSDFMIGLFRSGTDRDAPKHVGLSQFLIDMQSSGISVRPITDLTGEHHFNEVHFDNVFVPDHHLIGEEGNAWQQVVSELAFERSQPDRFLSCFVLLPMLIDKLDAPDRLAKRRVGESVSDLIILREMSLSILGQLDAGKLPAQEAALVKDLGNTYEQKQPALVRELIDASPDIRPSDPLSDALGYLTQSVPSYSLRGGTREILRGIISKGLGLS